MQFEWDENKNLANFDKHGLNFETAIEAFMDPRAVIKFDRKIGNEARQHLISEIRGVIIVLIVFTKRDANYRIISARRASKKERREYYEKNDR